MWLCMNDGFLSVVASDLEPEKLLVRARDRAHIEAVFPGVEIEEDEAGLRDYQFRAILPREKVAAVVSKRLLETKYTNFKSSTRDHDLHHAYMEVWHVMHSTFDAKNRPRRRLRGSRLY